MCREQLSPRIRWADGFIAREGASPPPDRPEADGVMPALQASDTSGHDQVVDGVMAAEAVDRRAGARGPQG